MTQTMYSTSNNLQKLLPILVLFFVLFTGFCEAQTTTNTKTQKHDKIFYLVTNDKNIQAGDEFSLDFRPSMVNIEGYQFTLNYQLDLVDFIELNEGVAKQENFGSFPDKGVLTSSWEGELIEKEAILFSLVFRAKTDLKVSDVLSITSQLTPAEVYIKATADKGIQLWKDIKIDFAQDETGEQVVVLYQNEPNPVQNYTEIRYYLPKTTSTTLKIHDARGKVLELFQETSERGYHKIQLDARKYNDNILYYTLETDGFSATKKMVLVR